MAQARSPPLAAAIHGLRRLAANVERRPAPPLPRDEALRIVRQLAARGQHRAAALAALTWVRAFRFSDVSRMVPEDVTVVVNTGDDRAFYGVHVSPDLDIVTYTLANRIDPKRGFGESPASTRDHR